MAEHLLTTWIPAVDGPSRHSRMLQAGIQKVRGLDARFRGMTLFLEAVPSFRLAKESNRSLVMATAQLRNPG